MRGSACTVTLATLAEAAPTAFFTSTVYAPESSKVAVGTLKVAAVRPATTVPFLLQT